MLKSTAVSGLLVSLGAQNAVAEERTGDDIDGSDVTTQQEIDLAEAVMTAEFSEAVVDTEFTGVTEQAQVFEQELHNFPVSADLDAEDQSGESDDNNGEAAVSEESNDEETEDREDEEAGDDADEESEETDDSDEESEDDDAGETVEPDQVDGSFTLLSSGLAEDATEDIDFFASTDVGGPSIPNYSPDNFDANNIATLSFDFVVPDGAEGVAFDWKFGTEESPSFLGSQFQDFFEAVLITPDGSFSNIALFPDDTPVTVDNNDNYANTPGGSSQSPDPPFPDPPDSVYNAVTTDTQTGIANVAAFQGQTVRLRLRVADATDGVFDSAVFVDNLRFVGDVDIDASLAPAIEALDNYQTAVIDAIERSVQAHAREEAELFAAHGTPDEMITYFGIEAGELPADELDPEVLETFEDTIAGLSEERALNLFQFLQQLYAGADPAAGVESLTDYFADQYLTEYDVGGTTISQTLAEFNDEFDDYSANLISEIEEEDFSEGEINQFVSFWNDLRLEIERAAVEYERDAEDFIQTIAEDGEFTGHVLASERLPTEDDAATPEAIGTAIVVGYLCKKAAAAGVASKAASSATAAKASASSAATTATGKAVGVGAAAGSAAFSAAKTVYSLLHAYHKSIHIILEILVLKPELVGGPDVGVEGQPVPETAQEAIELDQQDATIVTVEADDLDLFDALFSGDGIDAGVQTGTVEILNTGSTAYTPEIDAFVSAESLPPAGQSTDTGYPVQFTEPIPELDPGDSVSLEIEYTVPIGVFTSEYELTIEAPQQDASGSAPFTSGLLQFPNISTETVLEGALSDGEQVGVSVEPDLNTETLTFELEFSQLNADLHLYDSGDVDETQLPSEIDANHVGFSYQQNEFVSEIDNATFSGRDEGVTGTEFITVPIEDDTEYTSQVIAPTIDTIIQGDSVDEITVETTQSNDADSGTITAGKQKNINITQESPDIEYSLDQTEVEPAPPGMSVGPGEINADGERGEATNLTLSINEINGFETLSDVTVALSDEGLVPETEPTTIPPTELTITDGVDVAPGSTEQIPINIAVPEDINPDFYSGSFEVVAEGGAEEATIPIELNVEMHPSGVFEGLFEEVDQDGTGELSRDDVRSMIQDYAQEGNVNGVPIDRSDVQNLIRFYA